MPVEFFTINQNGTDLTSEDFEVFLDWLESLCFCFGSRSQACPSSADLVEVICVLAEPGHVSQVVLTISHGTDDATSPVSFDLRVGRTLDDLHLVLEVLFLLICFSFL